MGTRTGERRLVPALIVVLAFLYISSYIVLSRRGFAEVDRLGLKGFYYIPYEDSDRWKQMNRACIYVYTPLHFIDQSLGLGRAVGAEPMRGLN